MARSLPAEGRAQRERRLGWLGFVIVAAALAGVQPLAQSAGCSRCSGAAPPTSAVPQSSGVGPAFAAIPREVRSRENRPRLGKGEARASTWRSGSYPVCVRACDGGFFPVPYVGDNDTLGKICQALCPNANVQLYLMPSGGTIDQAVSATGGRYTDLPNAGKFEQTYDASCSCRPNGQSWADALANAEARYGGRPHDVMVTPELAEKMSRPAQDPKASPARIDALNADATALVEAAEPPAPAEPTLDLDADGIDAGLSAAAAAISRETSGITDGDAQAAPHYSLNQGRVVEQADPQGLSRRVRIIGPMI